jgi:four helix bundle protein
MPGARRVQDLDVYQLSVQLRREIVRLTSEGPASSDHRFVTQIRNAARGGPRNVSEGFSRFVPAEFRKFLSYAKASLDETMTHVEDGWESDYFTDDECEQLQTLIRRTVAAISKLMRYLESPEAMRAYQENRKARRNKPYAAKRSEPNPRTLEP